MLANSVYLCVCGSDCHRVRYLRHLLLLVFYADHGLCLHVGFCSSERVWYGFVVLCGFVVCVERWSSASMLVLTSLRILGQVVFEWCIDIANLRYFSTLL